MVYSLKSLTSDHIALVLKSDDEIYIFEAVMGRVMSKSFESTLRVSVFSNGKISKDLATI
jgi:hypothetical protein